MLIVPTTRPETIEQYSIRVAEQWKLGRKGVDDGALLLVAKDDRALRIEVGYGLEGVLPDVVAKRIIEDIIVPRFKSGDFYAGIDTGVDAMIKVVDGEPLPPPQTQWRGPGNVNGGNLHSLFIIGIILVFGLGGILRAVVGDLPAASVDRRRCRCHRLVPGEFRGNSGPRWSARFCLHADARHIGRADAVAMGAGAAADLAAEVAADSAVVGAGSAAVARRAGGERGSQAHLPPPVHHDVERAPRIPRILSARGGARDPGD